MRFILTTITLLFLSACSITSPDLNKQLSVVTPRVPPKNNRSEELTVVLTFSGGGTRAAALSYGVLKALRDTPIILNNKKRRLLDEVDLISSVSGGSFTSAYYGLFGDEIFNNFEKAFLKKQVQSDLLQLSLLSPKAWIRLLPGLFERSDLAAEYYNQFIFKKKRFRDIRKDAPYIVINATDLSLGQGFAFTDNHFRWICSNLDDYPISRAVAASSAVPILFSPITLKNHAAKCNYSPIIWADKNTNANTSTSTNKKKRYEQSLQIKKYRNHEQYKYLHLVDGGVADNLGIRSLIDLTAYQGNSLWNTLNTYKMQKTKKLVFIVVNALGFPNLKTSKRRLSPSTLDVIETTARIQFDKYNVETIDLLRSKFPLWKKQIAKGRCATAPTSDCANIEMDIIEVNLHDLTAKEKAELSHVPTSLELPAETVDKLTAAGSNLLLRSETYQKVLKSLRHIQ
ncbi:MAG: patatin-like phospholipase family protein [Cocleimonas sp.]